MVPVGQAVRAHTNSDHHAYRIGQIDNAVYTSLYQRGIAEKDIFFSAVIPRKEKDYEWDFTDDGDLTVTIMVKR